MTGRRCSAMTRAGQPCTRPPCQGLDLCASHRDAALTQRWPWQPLADILGPSVKGQAARLEVDSRQISRWEVYGVDDQTADEIAIKLGSHPGIIWEDWHLGSPLLSCVSDPLRQDEVA